MTPERRAGGGVLPASRLEGVAWPPVPSDGAATMLAMQYQLDRSQWLPAAGITALQTRQLALSLRHAHDTVPYWRERLAAAGYAPGDAVTPEWIAGLPVLERGEAQSLGDALLSGAVPPAHGRVYRSETSGSTGRPLAYHGTELSQFYWRAFTLREHVWHRRDLSGSIAGIRKNMKRGVFDGWGPATDVVYRTGKCHTFDLGEDLDAQLDWLAESAPDYLISAAYNIYWLARRSLERGIRVPNLKEARCYGGTFPEDARETIRRAWGVGLVDMYTAEEVGYIALQCPEHEHYHVQSENLLVEIVRPDGRPCAPGETGRVLLTTLHNFAMPLVRYALGDWAVAGGPCPCGRGLPVIRRILGRQRNIMVMPDGTRHWPSFPSDKWSAAAPLWQLQLVQKSSEAIEVRVVPKRPLQEGEKAALVAALQGCLGHPFRMNVVEVPDIPRSGNLKFEDFVSEIAG